MDLGAKRVAVAVRVRPVLRNAIGLHYEEQFHLDAVTRQGDNGIQVQEQKQDEACRSSMFQFDFIFDQESTQLEVYEEAVLDLVDAALAGNCATILAYGQTGSGKTHTVLGEVKANPLEADLLTSNSGLFLRVLSDLMEYKARRKGKTHVIIVLSCLEIYNEQISDLFGGLPSEAPPPVKLIMTDESVLTPGLILKEVTSVQSVFNEIQLAISRRHSRSTELNATSSRSHCLFNIDIMQQAATAPPPPLSLIVDAATGTGSNSSGVSRRSSTPIPQSPADSDYPGIIFRVPGQEEPVYTSKIVLADLAGSERIRDSGVSGDGRIEATSINSSLTALGNVVHSLYEGTYVSYRVSNLTRLLRPAFSQASSRVLLLAQVSPTQLTYDETMSTLRFANKVKAMKVVTTTGAETEKLLFDVMEHGKAHEGIVADLRIWMATSLCKNVLRSIGVTGRRGQPIGKVASGKAGSGAIAVYRGKERMVVLQQCGAVDAAAAAKAKEERRQLEEKRREEAERPRKIAAAVAKVVAEHEAAVDDLQGSIEDEAEQLWAQRMQLCKLNAIGTAEAITVEEHSQFQGLLRRHHDGFVALATSRLAEMAHELAAVQTAHRETGKEDEAAKEEWREADLKYAESVFAHCNAKRFHDAFCDLRDAQSALLLAQGGCAKLASWVAKHRIPPKPLQQE